MSAQPTDFNHRRWRYHNFQFFTLHFQLKKPSSQMQGRHKDVVPPWFAFIGGDCHGRRRPRNDTINASKRNNGRSRGSLPIDISTPRPCSAAFFVPPRTYRGSLNASVSVLSCSQFLTYNFCIIATFTGFCQLQSSDSACRGRRLGVPKSNALPAGRRGRRPLPFFFCKQ